MWEDKKEKKTPTAVHINGYISSFLSPYSFTSRTHSHRVHTCKIDQLRVFFASRTLALITEYMILAGGGSTTGSFAFELI